MRLKCSPCQAENVLIFTINCPDEAFVYLEVQDGKLNIETQADGSLSPRATLYTLLSSQENRNSLLLACAVLGRG